MAMTALLSRSQSQAPALPKQHRHVELEWREAHPEALRSFAGSWVVLEGQTVVGHGSDPCSLVATARQMGFEAPYVFFVEAPAENTVHVGI